MPHGLHVEERARLDADGYLVRHGVLSAHEVRSLRDAVETVSTTITGRATRAEARQPDLMADGHRIQLSSYTVIQWEWREGSRQIRLCEPCEHLHPAFAELFADDRFTEPAAGALDVARVHLFTTKLNLKRAAEGSEFPWHQDFPYWYVSVDRAAADVITAVVFLDDARAENGALRVLPGSHVGGPAIRDPHDPTRFLADVSRLPVEREVVVEVPAGSVVWFGPYLVHRSSPNTTGGHRRALLPSYQPVGRPRLQAVPRHPERVEELP